MMLDNKQQDLLEAAKSLADTGIQPRAAEVDRTEQ